MKKKREERKKVYAVCHPGRKALVRLKPQKKEAGGRTLCMEKRGWLSVGGGAGEEERQTSRREEGHASKHINHERK